MADWQELYDFDFQLTQAEETSPGDMAKVYRIIWLKNLLNIFFHVALFFLICSFPTRSTECLRLPRGLKMQSFLQHH
jgi:hypothetical protein